MDSARVVKDKSLRRKEGEPQAYRLRLVGRVTAAQHGVKRQEQSLMQIWDKCMSRGPKKLKPHAHSSLHNLRSFGPIYSLEESSENYPLTPKLRMVEQILPWGSSVASGYGMLDDDGTPCIYQGICNSPLISGTFCVLIRKECNQGSTSSLLSGGS